MGKTTLALKTVAANQARDPDWTVVWVAAEDYNSEWAQKLGVDNRRVILVEENEMEIAFQAVLDFSSTKEVDAVVIDSLPMLEPNRERAGVMEDFQPGLAAFLTGKFFRKARKSTKRSLTNQERPVLGLVINQWREKIGVMYGDPRTTPGGKAKNFAYTTRVECTRDEWIKAGERKVGQVMKFHVIKNKSAPAGRLGYVNFYFVDHGKHKAGSFDAVTEAAVTGMDLGVIERKGAYYRFEGRQWQGRQPLFTALADEPDLARQVHEAVLAVVRGQPSARVEDKRPKAAKVRTVRRVKR
jgi:recombination protein RecA